MKNILKIIIYIVLVMFITFIVCIVFIKPKVFDFKATKEYEYIQNNKKDIEKIIIRNIGQLGESCYKLGMEEAYEILDNISIKKETGFCSSSDVYLEFYFDDGIYKRIYFECENLFYDNKRYELEDRIILFNEDEYVLDEITEGMIIVSNKDKIDCN